MPERRATLVAAIFDMDGLLVDSEPLWHRAEIAVFGRYGVALSDELCRTTKGMFVADVARLWHARSPWTGPTPEEVAAEVVDAVAALLADEAALLPGVHHALDFCARRVPQLALASSSPRRLIDIVLDRFALRDRFAVVHSAESERAGKPDPAIFLSTAALLAVPPHGCVVFEDAPAGVAAALAAGMRCVAVPERHAGSVGDRLHGADAVLASLEDLAEGTWQALEARVESSSG